MKRQRTSIGLDVHARSVVGCGLDGDTGEVFQRRLCPDHREVLEWIGSLPAPVAVTYEAGPTGFGLARALDAAGIDCVVAAPSKLQRPAGDRVKTDARDAAHLARLLHLGQVVAVTIPSVAQEAARDAVRAREDCRGDLMTVRHRISKLLLRQGIVYSGGQRGRESMSCGCGDSTSMRPGCSWPSTRRSTRWSLVCTAVTVSMRRSRRWPLTVSSPRWYDG